MLLSILLILFVPSMKLLNPSATFYVECTRHTRDLGANITKILDSFFEHGYDKRVRPKYGGPPVEVQVSMHIVDISSVSEVLMDFTSDFYFRQTWTDPRLVFPKLSRIDTLSVGAEVAERIWVPDTFFANEKNAYFHTATTPNTFLRIKNNGEVLRSMRLTVIASCPMKLQYFPMDRQKCTIEVESYGYDMLDIMYRWSHEEAVTKSKMVLPQFVIIDHQQSSKTSSLTTGNYSRLICTIFMERSMGYYLIQIYIPASLIVVISWVSFWLHRNATPARVQLGVLTVLTMTTLMSSTNSQLPKISYVKSIDVFLGTCFIMVFAALLEYAAVGYIGKRISMRKNRYTQMQKSIMEKRRQLLEAAAMATQSNFEAGVGFGSLSRQQQQQQQFHQQRQTSLFGQPAKFQASSSTAHSHIVHPQLHHRPTRQQQPQSHQQRSATSTGGRYSPPSILKYRSCEELTPTSSTYHEHFFPLRIPSASNVRSSGQTRSTISRQPSLPPPAISSSSKSHPFATLRRHHSTHVSGVGNTIDSEDDEDSCQECHQAEYHRESSDSLHHSRRSIQHQRSSSTRMRSTAHQRDQQSSHHFQFPPPSLAMSSSRGGHHHSEAPEVPPPPSASSLHLTHQHLQQQSQASSSSYLHHQQPSHHHQGTHHHSTAATAVTSSSGGVVTIHPYSRHHSVAGTQLIHRPQEVRLDMMSSGKTTTTALTHSTSLGEFDPNGNGNNGSSGEGTVLRKRSSLLQRSPPVYTTARESSKPISHIVDHNDFSAGGEGATPFTSSITTRVPFQVPLPKNINELFGVSPSDIDKYSRVVFPVCFVCFNLMYWMVYLHISKILQEKDS